MSDLLLMSPPGLPRNGLVALYDPYRDTYGRNVGSNANFSGVVDSSAWGTTKVTLTESGTAPSGGRATKIAHTATTSSHGIYTGSSDRPAVVGATLWFSVCVKPAECGFVRLSLDSSQYANFNLTTGAVASVSGTPPLAYGIIPLADGWFRCYIAKVMSGSTIAGIDVYKAFWSELGIAGEGILAGDACFNLGPVLHAYSPPAGAPGTLQTSLDYSGNGNHLTLGATTGASTDDPAFTGTAWSFDGGDYLKGGDLSTQGKFYCGVFVFTNASAINKSTSGQTICTLENESDLAGFVGIGSLTVRLTDEIVTVGDPAAGTGRSAYCHASESIAAGTHLLITYWDGVKYAIEIDGVSKTVTTYATPRLINMNAVYLGVTAVVGPAFSLGLTNPLNLSAIYTRVPSASERARMTLYLKGLMARRGVTPAW